MIDARAGAKRAKTRKQRLREVYHTKTLTAVARQCRIHIPNSDEFFEEEVAKAAWKEKFRSMFHPGRSTENLSEDEYAALIQQVEAWAVIEHAVDFETSAAPSAGQRGNKQPQARGERA